jgi:hypothetical protein
MLKYFGFNSGVQYEVGEVTHDYDKSCDETILETFCCEKDAIKYVVELYIGELLTENKFSNTECKYYYRKKYDDMYSGWVGYDINKLEEFCKLNDKPEIKKYLYDYNVYKNKINSKNQSYIKREIFF